SLRPAQRDQRLSRPAPGHAPGDDRRRAPGLGSATMAAEPPPSAAREAMERLNGEAAGLHIWLRTQANAPAQRPWFQEGGIEAGGRVAEGRVGANQMKAAAHLWRWHEIGPYLDRIAEIARTADVSPIEFADRQ